ncbi:ATP-binding protein [Streptomyces sp. NBC_00572]|uniref:ATP-binding protein n=1 Tax=Streptomyces sp. NBC_00572 TaxID=2903664 RepID=UPI00224C974B|nr:ATP-binding protein [Streptomyces sp. NBC_00572]MCX4986797.1 ATP-binding protein [Streptomyces sp. NBC_00572]
MSDAANRYDAGRIHVIEGLEAIRKRPGMYVGSTGPRGLHELVFGVMGRAVNEVLMRGGGPVDVTLTSDGGVRIADDVPGIPFEDAGDAGTPGLEARLTRLYAGTEPVGRRAAGLDRFGLGLCVANALSSRLTVEVRREGARSTQEYARGVALTPPAPAGPATGSGTTLVFWPDADMFETTEFSYDVLAERFRELAFLNRGLRISLTDERSPGEAGTERFEGGVPDFLAVLETRAGGTPVHVDIIGFETEDPRMAGSVEVAFRWCDSHEEVVHSFANSVRTPEGGEHVAGFRAALADAVTAYAEERRLLRAANPVLGAARVGEGLTAVLSVKLDQPEYGGATHGRLAGAAVRSCVEEAVRDHVGAWLERHPEQAAAVVDRIVRGAGRD